MKNITSVISLFLAFALQLSAQEFKETPKAKESGHPDINKFRQMYDLLATQKVYRPASGAQGPE